MDVRRWCWFAFWLVATLRAQAPAETRTPAEAIRVLIEPPPLSLYEQMGMFSCGGALSRASVQREAAVVLAEHPDVALPLIEPLLNDDHSVWPWLVYARIKGRAALPKLLEKFSEREARVSLLQLERAAALALSATAFVAGKRVPGRIIRCEGVSGPREALEDFVVAWQSGSQKDRASAGIAFRFQTTDLWASPAETLVRGRTANDQRASDQRVDVVTVFMTATGQECGRLPLRFLAVGRYGEYRIASDRVARLTAVLSACKIAAGP